jgi:sugar O-acyltransferase (sialic acid O-acetyltransferase NeuD family)
MKDIVIVGAGGFAKEIYLLIKEINEKELLWNFIGFVDIQKKGAEIIDGFKVIGDDNYVVSNLKSISIVIGVGVPDRREVLYDFYKKKGALEFPNMIHPSVIADFENTQIGEANIIAGNSILSANIRIGVANIINMSSIIAHDVKISNYCVINPGANISGNVTIENNCVVGANSVVHPGITLKEGSILGLGSALICNTKPHISYMGNPAKRII